MECERLLRLIKSWYVQMQDEALAPARMVEFMESHVADCVVCLTDPLVKREIEKIVKLVLPQSKLVRSVEKDDDDDDEPVERNVVDDDIIDEEEDKYADDEDDEGDDVDLAIED